MTKTISTLVLASILTFGGARAHANGAGDAAMPGRGDVLVRGPSVKAVVVGPTVIHAYSGFTGGTLYTARAVSGTDADCQGGVALASRAELPADKIVNFAIGAGEVACLVTTTTRSFELLWHAQKIVPGAATLLAHSGR